MLSDVGIRVPLSVGVWMGGCGWENGGVLGCWGVGEGGGGVAVVLVALAVGSVTERLTLTRDESKVLEFIESIRNTQVRPPAGRRRMRAVESGCFEFPTAACGAAAVLTPRSLLAAGRTARQQRRGCCSRASSRTSRPRSRVASTARPSPARASPSSAPRSALPPPGGGAQTSRRCEFAGFDISRHESADFLGQGFRPTPRVRTVIVCAICSVGFGGGVLYLEK